MAGTNEILLYSESVENVHQVLSDIDIIFFLDYNDLKRIGDLLETYVKITISSCNVGIGQAEVVEPKEEPKQP